MNGLPLASVLVVMGLVVAHPVSAPAETTLQPYIVGSANPEALSKALKTPLVQAAVARVRERLDPAFDPRLFEHIAIKPAEQQVTFQQTVSYVPARGAHYTGAWVDLVHDKLEPLMIAGRATPEAKPTTFSKRSPQRARAFAMASASSKSHERLPTLDFNGVNPYNQVVIYEIPDGYAVEVYTTRLITFWEVVAATGAVRGIKQREMCVTLREQ